MAREIKRFHHPQKIDQLMRHLGPKLVQKTGMLDGIIIQDWHLIVGADLANQCVPKKVVFPLKSRENGVLHIGVFDGASGMILQHKTPQILSRINQQYGYPAVTKLCMNGATPLLPKSKKSKITVKSLNDSQHAKLNQLLEKVPEGDLKGALKALGKNLI